ncbi:glycosyltransferase [Bordetella genomosp. 12]|nr:glycosyltransferase [Bordetella genomosp. 12]
MPPTQPGSDGGPVSVVPQASVTPPLQALLLCAHPPAADPRVFWVAEGAAADLLVHILGVGPADSPPVPAHTRRGGLTLTLPRQDSETWRERTQPGAAREALERLRGLARMSAAELEALTGKTVSPARVPVFNWQCRHLLSSAETLLSGALHARGHQVLIAADFDALIAALALKRLSDGAVKVLYDAHEFWPTSLGPDTSDWELDIWFSFERALLAEVDAAISVSPPLADHMTAFYGYRFDAVPNCEPLASGRFEPRPRAAAGQDCIFLFQGNFMPGRGMELLLDAWPHTPANAILELRGPDRPYKSSLMERARASGMLGKRVFFPEAVAESELVAAASAADVGLVPYEPTTLNSRYCSPNKVSQYMAAGLPVLSNRLDFVSAILHAAQGGLSVDFSDPAALIAAVSAYAGNPQGRRATGQHGRAYFEATFHWEKQSEPFYTALRGLPAGPAAPERFDFHLTDSAGQNKTMKQYLLRSATNIWHHLPPGLKNRFRPLASRLLNRIRFR